METTVFKYVNEVFSILDGKEIPLGISLDFKKACDIIDHISLATLDRYGIKSIVR